MLLLKPTREAILPNSEAILQIIEQLGNSNTNIRRQAEQLLDIVQYYSNEWSNTIKTKKFVVHNQAYLQVVEEYERVLAQGQDPNEMYVGEDGPNEIQWYDSNDIGGRVWTNEPGVDYY